MEVESLSSSKGPVTSRFSPYPERPALHPAHKHPHAKVEALVTTFQATG